MHPWLAGCRKGTFWFWASRKIGWDWIPCVAAAAFVFGWMSRYPASTGLAPGTAWPTALSPGPWREDHSLAGLAFSGTLCCAITSEVGLAHLNFIFNLKIQFLAWYPGISFSRFVLDYYKDWSELMYVNHLEWILIRIESCEY